MITLGFRPPGWPSSSVHRDYPAATRQFHHESETAVHIVQAGYPTTEASGTPCHGGIWFTDAFLGSGWMFFPTVGAGEVQGHYRTTSTQAISAFRISAVPPKASSVTVMLTFIVSSPVPARNHPIG